MNKSTLRIICSVCHLIAATAIGLHNAAVKQHNQGTYQDQEIGESEVYPFYRQPGFPSTQLTVYGRPLPRAVFYGSRGF